MSMVRTPVIFVGFFLKVLLFFLFSRKSQIWKFKFFDLISVRDLFFLHRAFRMSFHDEILHGCAYHTHVCLWFFSEFFEMFYYFFYFPENHCSIWARVRMWISGRFRSFFVKNSVHVIILMVGVTEWLTCNICTS